MDYHYLDFADGNFDGVYTMETLVHTADPKKALGEFFRVLQPGGSIALHEYAQELQATSDNSFKHLEGSIKQICTRASMPYAESFLEDSLTRMLVEQGFQNVEVEDLSENVEPMTHLFFLTAYIPYMLIRLFRLQAWFVNTEDAVHGHRVLHRRLWRYLAISAKKPIE